ncbi:TPR-like protein [Butyriboletus roseoflavus]|nr:TPR-like protein [Butyriboletus roseoflavus]
MSMHNLAISLGNRYKQLGLMGDLNEAIVLNRSALQLCPPGHPSRYKPSNTLAALLGTRYNQLKAMEDLNEAIALHQDVLVLCPLRHRDRPWCLNILASLLCSRYQRLGGMEDLTKAIVLGRDALELCSPGHLTQLKILINLAVNLSERYEQLGVTEDLNEAIILNQNALVLCPPGHSSRPKLLNNLAIDLRDRYKELGVMEDLNEAIALAREALGRFKPGDPRRSYPLHSLADLLYTRFMRLSEAKDKEEVFSLYAELAQVPHVLSLDDLSAIDAWVYDAEYHHHPTTLLAYETSLRLLIQHLNALPTLPRHLSILKNLTSSLAVDAFSACLRDCSPTNAVELLEQGRGVFWSQLTRIRRFPLDDIITSGAAGKAMADKFMQLSSLIRDALDSPGADQHDRSSSIFANCPGSLSFLLPLPFSDLQHAASGGPVIIVNASKYSCDALVVLHDRAPFHIPLSITKTHVRELSSELDTLTLRAKSMDVTRDLGFLLRQLWDEVVSPIVEFLLTIHPSHSRIWWCPTAEFSLLPLHAAGPYRKGQQNLADLYVSSYTSTLTALIRARRHDPSNFPGEAKHFVAIGQANAIGESELRSVGTELVNISQRIDELATFTRIEGPESCIARVSEALGKNEWVHFACHGLANRTRPFESAFALHDGHFTIQHIVRCELENPQFAYLSACHTTVGDEESPDEVIHLASAMQFAGFRSVIGTMWAVDDGETNKITSMFYDRMRDGSGGLDHTRAAFALHRTMRDLVGLPFDQRILYIHLGA